MGPCLAGSLDEMMSGGSLEDISCGSRFGCLYQFTQQFDRKRRHTQKSFWNVLSHF